MLIIGFLFVRFSLRSVLSSFGFLFVRLSLRSAFSSFGFLFVRFSLRSVLSSFGFLFVRLSLRSRALGQGRAEKAIDLVLSRSFEQTFSFSLFYVLGQGRLILGVATPSPEGERAGAV